MPMISTIVLLSGCCYSVYNVENVVTMIRHYSTNLKVPPFSFPLSSLVKNMLKGVSGVYMLINTKNPTEFYIGSSVNLGRRLQEYFDIVKNTRTPKTKFEIKLSESYTDDWNVLIMTFVPPYLVLIEEQLAICTFFPTLNVNYNVVVNYWLPNFDLTAAIALATEYRDLFQRAVKTIYDLVVLFFVLVIQRLLS